MQNPFSVSGNGFPRSRKESSMSAGPRDKRQRIRGGDQIGRTKTQRYILKSMGTRRGSKAERFRSSIRSSVLFPLGTSDVKAIKAKRIEFLHISLTAAFALAIDLAKFTFIFATQREFRAYTVHIPGESHCEFSTVQQKIAIEASVFVSREFFSHLFDNGRQENIQCF